MFTDPATLIAQTIEHLTEVAELMKEEFDPRIHTELNDDAKNCRAVYMRILELIPKLHKARDAQRSPFESSVRPMCIGCE